VQAVRAFVLWGAGSLGAAEVGMLQALAAHHVQADLVVGASVGALNAAHYATRPSPAGVDELAALWLAVGRHDVYPLSSAEMLRALAENLPWHPLRGALRALGALNYAFPINPLTLNAVITGRRNYLFDNDRLAELLTRTLPVDRLEDTAIPLAVLAADVRNGDPVLLSRGPVLPALLASAAIPGVYPTVQVGGRVLMDGAVANHTTLDAAVECGADEVYLLSPGFSRQPPTPPSTVIGMVLHAYNLLAEQRMAASIARVEHRVRLHRLPPLSPVEVLPIDFRQTAELITRAAEVTTGWLDGDHEPLSSWPARAASRRRPRQPSGGRRGGTGHRQRPTKPGRSGRCRTEGPR
jgi:NTE family protein